ncbi:hypothetical protein BDV95DRAFT_607781 [Massariosphaeria phaeospora]|uniref:Zn(2)-C6 fungal-type domain-containing protein n=1 Tax=Massariosphaeria phaeospora TaxID=100035 RepID=A0A7C8I885_9PLEO|nr:hypothetical protein BDV95DRAFT_607781 [Massariosphaeria phaeospora]
MEIVPPLSKKRKLRKGVHSCWECKRRKIKCVFATSQHEACISCYQKAIDCISQADKDLTAESLRNGSTRVFDRRLGRVETLLEVLIKRQGDDLSTVSDTNSSVLRNTTPSTEKCLIPEPIPLSPGSTTLSETLHSFSPSQEEPRLLCASQGFIPYFFQQTLTRNYLALSATDDMPLTSARAATPPARNAHPVLIAQKLLMMACLIQYSPSESSIAESKARAAQMASAAIDMATTKDNIVNNAEGLECLMLEATYHANNGNLRRGFNAVRRAMAVAQLLGLHRAFHQRVPRIDDKAPAFDPSVIASRILDRNGSDSDSLPLTQIIDASIIAAAYPLPSSWWLIPALTRIDSPRDVFLATTRLVSQVFHFNLINQTHLPYIIKADFSNPDAALYEYSKAACATASREILYRYLVLQDSKSTVHAYHFIDFFALIAVITLLLLHLDRHWQSEHSQQNVLTHMRSPDRAMVEQVTTFMTKPPVCKAPQILEQLLAIEDEAFTSRSVGAGKILKNDRDRRPYFALKIPYYGEVRVNSVRVCFQRAVGIEDVSAGMETLLEADAERDGGLDEVLFEDWLDAELETAAGEGAYGGLGNVFLESFYGFVEDGTT